MVPTRGPASNPEERVVHTHSMSASLVDRVAERAAIESLIAGVRTGRSGALVLVGDAGIGKTVLIDFATGAADDLQVVRTIGVEAESTYPFAALHRLLAPFLDGVARLPDGQRQALDVAWGRATGPPAEPFLVGLATLSLLAEAATETSVLVCVDDAQWLDRESLAVLAFVARRVEAEGILVLFAAREGAGDLTALDGIPSMVVGGLDRADALELLHRVVDGALDAATADRVVTETAGHRRSGGGAVIASGHRRRDLGRAAPARSPVGSSLPHPGPGTPGGDPGLAPPRRRRTHGRPGRHHGGGDDDGPRSGRGHAR